MSSERNELYEFGPFRLNVGEHKLERIDGRENGSLPEKTFQILCILVQNSGHLLTKRELMDLVWPDSFVEENNLDKRIHAIRSYLGEKPGGQKYIETVRMHGYRFVAKVTDVSEAVLTQSHAVSVDREVPPPKRNTRIILFGVGFLTAIFLIAILSLNFQSSFFRNSNKAKSIAVLPLKPINTTSREPIYEYGIAESLILKLNASNGFLVRPLSATRKYMDVEQDPVAAGKEQQVDYVLAANYQLANGKIRVTAQLFNVESGQTENTKIIDKDAGDVFAIQDAIASEVGNILLARFAVTESSPLAKRGTTNEEAYRLYLQGRNLTGLDTEKAVEYFEQATRLDPVFAKSYLGIARAYIVSGMPGGGLRSVEYEKTRKTIEKAFELDGNLAEAFAVCGELRLKYEWDFAGAEKDLLHAIELEPNNDLAHMIYAMLLAYRARFDEATAEMDTTLAIAPDNVYYQFERSRILYYARQYDEAIVQLKRLVEADENAVHARSYLWLAYEMKGDTRTAYEMFIKNQEMNENEHLEDYKSAYAATGWRGVRLKLLEFNKLDENQSGSNFFAMARQCALIGEKEQAFEYLNKSFEKRQFQMVMLNVEPTLDSLRDDPRFEELVKRIGLN